MQAKGKGQMAKGKQMQAKGNMRKYILSFPLTFSPLPFAPLLLPLTLRLLPMFILQALPVQIIVGDSR